MGVAPARRRLDNRRILRLCGAQPPRERNTTLRKLAGAHGMVGDEKAIIGLLPFVRRYARALTGSQTRGDNYVRLCLETILAEPGRMEGEDAKLQLFKAFH